WPAILFVLPGIGLAAARRGEPHIRFLIAWAAGWWILVEAVPTKLPNYVLPALPPLLILAALWILSPKESAPGWRRFLPWIAALQFLIGLGGLIAAAALLPASYRTGAPPLTANYVLLAALSVAGLAGLAALILFLLHRRLWSLLPAFAASAILVLTLTAWIAP